MLRSVIAFVLFACVLVEADRAAACSMCSCGEPTLTSVGSEILYRHRVRASLDTRAGAIDTGDADNQHRTTNLVTTLAASYAPIDRLQLNALLPWQAIWSHAAGKMMSAVGLGDLLLSGRVVLFRDRRFAPLHVLSATVGVKTPTGPRLRGSDGYFLPDDDQPGSGSWDPMFGLSYATFAWARWSLFARSSGVYTTKGRHGYRRGSSFDTYVGTQYQPHNKVALQLDLNVLWRDADRLTNGARSPDSGGTWLGVTPALVVAPGAGALLRFALYVPAVQLANGHQWASPQGEITFSYDIH